MSVKICLFCGRAIDGDNKSSYWHEACIKSFFGESTLPVFEIDDEILNKLASDNIIDGNTVGGVQKKLSLEFKSKRKKKTLLSNKFIVKPHEAKYPLLNIYEWIGNRLASLCGFKVVQSGLIKTSDDNYLYITKRIDRKVVNNKIIKLPMEDFCQLSETMVEDKYEGSYEKTYKKVIAKYSNNKIFDTIEYFRMIFFSYIIGNTDLHLKNFSLLKENHFYMLSPFYDVVPVLMVVNQIDMALTINGKRRNITKKDFIKFGMAINLDERIILSAMNSILSKLDTIFLFIKKSPLPSEEQERFIKFIKSRIEKMI